MDNEFYANRMFEAVCHAMDSERITYEKTEKKRMIEFFMDATPFPVKYRIAVRAESNTISFFSELPFRVPESRAEWFSLKLAQLVYDNLYVGTYDFNVMKGSVIFRTELMYRESLISENTILLMKHLVYDTVCKFNERIFKLTRGEE